MVIAIKDSFTKSEADRRYKYQLRKLKDGLCRICGQKRDASSKNFCTKHLEAHRERNRLWAQRNK
jgi:hypothetical protein